MIVVVWFLYVSLSFFVDASGKFGMLPVRGIEVMFLFLVLCVFFCTPANDGLCMLVFVSLIVVVFCFWYVSLFLVYFIDLFVDFCDGCRSKWWTWYAGWSRDWGESFVAPPSSANLISPQDQSLKKKKEVFQSFLFFLHAVEP